MRKVIVFDEERFSSILQTVEAYLVTNEEYLEGEDVYRIKDDITFLHQCITSDLEEIPSDNPLMSYLIEHYDETEVEAVEEIVSYITEEHFTEDDVCMYLNTCIMLETMDEKVNDQITKLFEYYTNKNK